MGYVRLQECSDWGNLYLTLPGEGLAGPWKTASSERGIRFQDGQRVHIRWPNNEQTVETIVHRVFRSTVSDMGHSYPVENRRPGIELEVRGVKHWEPLAELDVLAEDVVAGKPPAEETES
jgi:hypothetical protein